MHTTNVPIILVCTAYSVHCTECAVYSLRTVRIKVQSYRHQICDFEMRVNEMLAIVVLYYN